MTGDTRKDFRLHGLTVETEVEVVDLWRKGLNTAEIAKQLWLKESEIANNLGRLRHRRIQWERENEQRSSNGGGNTDNNANDYAGEGGVFGRQLGDGGEADGATGALGG